MNKKLFAVYLGGQAPKSNIELHDVVFVVGETIENTYSQCINKWFGMPKGLHLDSWMELNIVDGYRVSLSAIKPENENKLYFINLGAYKDGEFMEIHANKFLVARNPREAMKRAKKDLLQNWPSSVHTDNVYEIDDCMELNMVDSLYVVLNETTEQENLRPNNAYRIIPKTLVEDYIKANHHLRYSK